MTKQSKQQIAALWWMVGILMLATALYLINLNRVSFWQDESWMAIAISGSIGDIWSFTATRNVHPPLYFYIAYLLQSLFGNSEFALRWMGGLFSLLGIAFTYRLGTELLDRKTGLYAAAIVSGSFFLVYLTRLARHYTLFYLLSVALVWAYWRWRNHPTQWRWWIAIAGLQAAAFYTHYFSAFIAFTIAFHAFIDWLVGTRIATEAQKNLLLTDLLKLAGALLLSAILFLPWIPAISTQMQSDLGAGISYGIPDVPRILDNYSGRMTNDNLWLGGAMALVGIFGLVMQRKWRVGLLLLIWLVGTFIPILIVNKWIFQWYIDRNMLYTLPAIGLLYGAGLAYVSRTRWGLMAAIATTIAFTFFGVYVYDAYWPGTPDWRSILHRISQDARPDDIFVLDSSDPYTADYYLWRYLDERIVFYDMEAWTENPILGERIWFIDDGMDVNHEALAAVSDTMVRTRRFFWSPLVADFWQTPPPAPDVVYGEQLALGYLGTETITIEASDILQVDVWWQAIRPPDFNYSAGFLLLGDSGVIAQQDGNFDSGRVDAQVLPLETWTPDVRNLQISADAIVGEYTLFVTVYDWRDNTRLTTNPISTDDLYPLATVIIEAD
ncbi:MAG: glycosyltransferase family 39 protein [Anaerolineae bacterium]|nr:glycosyltransferase family 39 protein [Anaerolineae bacterium]